jgi:hypothetical protein
MAGAITDSIEGTLGASGGYAGILDNPLNYAADNRSLADPNNYRQLGVGRDNLERQGAGESQRYQDEILGRTGADTRRTPEMLRSEYYQRLADMENNRLYYRPSVTRFGTGTGTQVVQEGGAYQMPKIETEDMRQQGINRTRQGEKLSYQELGRKQAADQVVQALVSMRGMNAQDIEKLQEMDKEDLVHRMGANNLEINNRVRVLKSDIQAKEDVRKAAAKLGISLDMMYTILALTPDMGYGPMASVMGAVGMDYSGVLQELMGNIGVAAFGQDRVDGMRRAFSHVNWGQ